MPRALPNSHKDVRKSVVHLLKNGRLFGRLFSADVIANLLNTAAEIDFDAELRFTKDIVTAAFSTGYDTSAIPLANFGIEHTDAIVFTHVSQQNQHGAKRQTTIGCFRNEAEAARAAAIEQTAPRLNLMHSDMTKILLVATSKNFR